MLLWTLKLLSSLRRAIAGRRYPHQLAWAVAFGLLLGIIPHGNLLAVMVLIVVLSLKINHAMAGLTAVGATFLATHLDVYSHQVGQTVLSDPQLHDYAVQAWQLPLMPWTDLNNTVVLGSFVIGVAALIPTFVVTYPIFRLFAPRDDAMESSHQERSTTTSRSDDAHSVVLFDDAHATTSQPKRRAHETVTTRSTSDRPTAPDSDNHQVEFPSTDDASSDSPHEHDAIAVETRIDVIRMKDAGVSPNSDAGDHDEESGHENQPMDEALNYLLRQLRDSQQRNAA